MIVNFTYPRSRRLLKRRDFMRALKSGKRMSNSQLSFAIIDNDENNARLGVTLAKRFIKKATHRNKIRRQIKESFRLQANLKNLDIVVQTRKTTDLNDIKQIRKAADELFARLPKTNSKDSC